MLGPLVAVPASASPPSELSEVDVAVSLVAVAVVTGSVLPASVVPGSDVTSVLAGVELPGSSVEPSLVGGSLVVAGALLVAVGGLLVAGGSLVVTGGVVATPSAGAVVAVVERLGGLLLVEPADVGLLDRVADPVTEPDVVDRVVPPELCRDSAITEACSAAGSMPVDADPDARPAV